MPFGGLHSIMESGQVLSDLSLNPRSVMLNNSSNWRKLLNLSELVSLSVNLSGLLKD